MMAITSCLGCSTECFLLVLVVTGLSISSPVWCQFCNTNRDEPQIIISSTPPSNHLSIGAGINLTCFAWQTNELVKDLRTRPYTIEWFDPQEKQIGIQCRAGLPPAINMSCTLEVGALTDGNLGNYTCRASNYYNYCSTKTFQVDRQQADVNKSSEVPPATGKDDTKRLVFIVVPVLHQTASLGSNVTFACIATGYPKPTITWEKVNDSGSVQYNLTAGISRDAGGIISSELVITEVKSKDYGIYRCLLKNSVEKISTAVFLSPKDEASQPSEGKKDEVSQSSEGKKGPSTRSIVAISVTLSIAIMFMGAVSVFWRRIKERCSRNQVKKGTIKRISKDFLFSTAPSTSTKTLP